MLEFWACTSPVWFRDAGCAHTVTERYTSFGPAPLQSGSYMRVEHVLLEASVLFVCPTTPDMAVVGGRVL